MFCECDNVSVRLLQYQCSGASEQVQALVSLSCASVVMPGGREKAPSLSSFSSSSSGLQLLSDRAGGGTVSVSACERYQVYTEPQPQQYYQSESPVLVRLTRAL